MLRIGIDLSLTSPGIAINNTVTKKWYLYGFLQKKSQPSFEYESECIHLKLLPHIPDSSTQNEQRYEHIRYHLVDHVLCNFRHDIDNYDTTIHIESYAFSTKSGSSYKLQELGGIVKHSIWKSFPNIVQHSVPPTSWKKSVVGNGRATKLEVLQWIKDNGPCISLLDILNLSLTKSRDVPCPCQDISDAMCIALHDVSNNLKKRKIKEIQ